MELDSMKQIMAEKDKTTEQNQQALDSEGQAIAEHKRKTFDLPTNAVKVDPLR